MLGMFWQAVRLFLRGKLFQDPRHVVRQTAVGVVTTAVLCVALVKLCGSLWIAVAVSALIGGALQPVLFRNLKYN